MGALRPYPSSPKPLDHEQSSDQGLPVDLSRVDKLGDQLVYVWWSVKTGALHKLQVDRPFGCSSAGTVSCLQALHWDATGQTARLACARTASLAEVLKVG